MKITEEERNLLVRLYKRGLVSETVIFYVDIEQKIKSLPFGKLSHKVKKVAADSGVSVHTIYRALRFLR